MADFLQDAFGFEVDASQGSSLGRHALTFFAGLVATVLAVVRSTLSLEEWREVSRRSQLCTAPQSGSPSL